MIIGFASISDATDARGPNYLGATQVQGGLSTYGPYQPQRSFNGEMSGNLRSAANYPQQNQMSGAMTQGSNRGNFYPGQQPPMSGQVQPNRNQGMGNEQMMGGQPMENFQGPSGMNDQVMGNLQSNYGGNQGMGPGMVNEPMMGNHQMGYQPQAEQMNPMGSMNPNNFGGQGQINPMAQPGMNPQQGMGMSQGFQPQPNNFGNQQNPQMFNDEMGQEERMGAGQMEPATFGANAAF